MDFYYTSATHVQVLLALLKKHGIHRAVVSPGTQNIEFVASMQQDTFFELFSCVDERSAAYMACGIASETGEPVVISCTEATASRNYLPGLTEAFHRKLPILAVTCLHSYSQIGNLQPQVIDRSVAPVDAIKCSVDVQLINDNNDKDREILKINKAILELTHHTPGPVHINLPGSPAYDMQTKELPDVRIIKRYSYKDCLPELPVGRVAIFMGAHRKWSADEIQAIDRFCENSGAIVFCDKTSQYTGKYAVFASLMAFQSKKYSIFENIETLIHVGEETADTFTQRALKKSAHVWRVSEDGELRDTFRKLTDVFEMDELYFFNYYCKPYEKQYDATKLMHQYHKEYTELMDSIPELPFSNFYIASKISNKLPSNAVLHIGASNSIRAWTFFENLSTVRANGNVGCRGIDGCLSSMIGASLVNRESIFYGVVGDLTFFYDMNSLGNRSIGNNVRILLINNGNGNIFKHNEHPAHLKLGDDGTDLFMSAGGHFGRKSPTLVMHYAQDLGFEYLTASNKEEFSNSIEHFLTEELTDKPILFEVFTEDLDESAAYTMLSKIKIDIKEESKGKAIDFAKNLLGAEGVKRVKTIIKK